MIRGLALVGLCVLAAAPPAAAETVANSIAAAGPTLAGDAVVWGRQYRDGRLAVLSRVPGHKVRVIERIPAVHGKDRSRQFGGVPGAVAATPTRAAYVLVDDHVTDRGSDYVTSESSVTAHWSLNGSPFADPLGCDGAYISTEAEGDTVVFAVNGSAPCGGIWVGARKLSESANARQVRLAGSFVAWLDRPGPDERLTVADVNSGAVVGQFAPPRGRHTWWVFDIDEHGNIVVAEDQRLIAFTVTDSHPRVLAKRVYSLSVATAAGRVAYVTERSGHADRLVVADLNGTPLRRVYRYGKSHQPIGELALSDRRVAWTVLHGPDPAVIRGPGSVLTETL